jgi:hypothetical protein
MIADIENAQHERFREEGVKSVISDINNPDLRAKALETEFGPPGHLPENMIMALVNATRQQWREAHELDGAQPGAKQPGLLQDFGLWKAKPALNTHSAEKVEVKAESEQVLNHKPK